MAALSLVAVALVSVGLFLAALSLVEPGLERARRPLLVAVGVSVVVLVVLGVAGELEL